MSYAGAIERLLSLVRPETSPARRHAMAQAGVLRLLHGLDDPHQSLAVVHVAGSKGKGSTAHYIEAVLRGCGLRTGLYTSPHLVDWTERIRIDGAPVTEQAFADALDDVWTVLLRETPTGGAHADVASFFDVLTAAACHEFARRGVQVAVVECGLGGRFDATNVFASRVGIITTLELEHTDRLGQRIESIAWHKAGIARRDRPLLIGPMPENARRVVSMEARAVGARLHDQREFIASPPRVCDTNILLDYQHAGLRLDVRLPGPALHAAENACLALAAAHLGELVDPASLRTHAAAALAGCQPPGRLQLFPGPPRLLVDAAHTEGSARALREVIAQLAPSQLRLVLSSSRQRLPATLIALAASAAMVHVVSAERFRSLSPSALAGRLRDAGVQAPIRHHEDMQAALQAACGEAAAGSLVCVAGSTYAAGAALACLEPRTRPQAESAPAGARTQ